MRLAVRADRGGRMFQDDADLADAALGLFAIADGMGASMSGRPAADLAIAALHKYYRESSQFVGRSEEERMKEAVLAANAAVWAKTNAASRYWERRSKNEVASNIEVTRWLGMGTTLVALRLCEGYACFAHVGDSRAYHYRDGALRQLTVDHRLRDEARRLGVPESEIRELPAKVIVRALGMTERVEVEPARLATASGDSFLLASDGLTDALPNHEIEGIFHKYARDLGGLAQELVAQAVARGSETHHDNVSVVLVGVGG